MKLGNFTTRSTDIHTKSQSKRLWPAIGGIVLLTALLFLVYLGEGRAQFSLRAPHFTFPNATADPVVIAAGDIAKCGRDGAESTARLLDKIDGTVIALGDNAYDTGTAQEYQDCYNPTWGRHKSRTRPIPGNHDYYEGGGAYYAYFGELAGPAGKGYYSYNLGGWHIVALNSNVPAGAGSEQERWLRADLTANTSQCTFAYWHHPVFSSGEHGNDNRMLDIWRALYEAKADVVLNSHNHNYERLAPQNVEGRADPERGIREFVVGTGGGEQRDFGKLNDNSEVRVTDTYGVLRMVLQKDGYKWEFISANGEQVLDAGEASCVR